MIQQDLAETEQHIALRRRLIARPKQIVAALERAGHENAASTARDLVSTFELTQACRVDERERHLTKLRHSNKT
jgi:hypothetical protein